MQIVLDIFFTEIHSDFMRNICLLLAVLIALNACNIFDLRDAELPSEEARWNDFASSWQLVLENLYFSYEDSRNAINYGRLFHPDYRFIFAQQDIIDYSTDAQWVSSQEQDMLLNLHAGFHDIKILMEPLEAQDEISSNEARIYRSYEIEAVPASGTESELIAQGNLDLQLRKQNGYWYIYRWYDYRSSGERTWGLLKYENG